MYFGMQSSERFGVGVDPDGDGVVNELTRGDVTALTMYVATLQVPGRVMPKDPAAARRVEDGERTFVRIGCGSCHVPSLALRKPWWNYSEPGPHNPDVRRQPGARVLEIDLRDAVLPQPRLLPATNDADVIDVPAFTDFKLHDITDPADRDAAEQLDINVPASSPQFLRGNRRFLTKRLWAVGNPPPYLHHGRYTTVREAVMAHAGEALEQRRAFERSSVAEQESILAFLGSLQILPPGTTARVVDEDLHPLEVSGR